MNLWQNSLYMTIIYSIYLLILFIYNYKIKNFVKLKYFLIIIYLKYKCLDQFEKNVHLKFFRENENQISYKNINL